MTITLTEAMTLTLFMVFFLFAKVANGFPYHQETDAIAKVKPASVPESSAYHSPPAQKLNSPENIHFIKEETNEHNYEEYETDRNQESDTTNNTVG